VLHVGGSASNERFSSLKNHLENQYIMGEGQYPSDSESLLGILNNFRMNENVKDRATLKRDTMDGGEGLEESQKDDGAMFVQEGMSKVWKKRDITAPECRHKEKRCHHCDQVGHIARDYPKMDPADMGNINVQFGFGALQRAKPSIKENYLYLDTSTIDKKGYLGSTPFWLSQGCANVIDIKTLEEICHKNNGNLFYHSKRDKGSFIAHLGGDKIVTFLSSPFTNKMIRQSCYYSLSAKTWKDLPRRKVQRAIQAYDAQAAMAYASEEDLKNEVSGKNLALLEYFTR